MELVLGATGTSPLSLCLLSLVFSKRYLFSLSQHSDFLHGVENIAEFYTLRL